MRELRDLAARLLETNDVQVVIGWEESRLGVRPAFARTPEEAGRLIFDERCVHNLAAYLHPRRKHIRALGRPAVVVKGCDARAVAGLIRDNQLRREDVVLIGVRCAGVRDDGPAGAEAPGAGADGSGRVAERCESCPQRTPSLCDHLVGADAPEAQPRPGLEGRVEELQALPMAERWAFWSAAFERCVRCYACREVCPLCFCERCVADKSIPQWIESSPHKRGNVAWHLARALHLAGRCVGCGECERACPAGIPLSLLNARLQQSVRERFEFTASDDPAVASPIGAFRQDDGQEFIR